ncbi:MAG TPA: ABC transporter substrate-binding protein [Chloroflexota bacterium]|nr:ABC transporter substrate-binding protein [Chloroflexota bacterium]
MKDIKPVVLGISALALSAFVLAGCSSSAPAPAATSAPAKAAEPTKPAAAPAGTTAPAAAAPAASGKVSIKIGLSTPLSGDVKTFGESTKNAFDIAVEEANAAGKVAITPVVVDDKGDPTEGVNGVTKLINQDKVQAIVGSVTSKVTIPVSEVAQANKIVMITSTSTNPKVTVDGGKRKDFAFRACFIDPFQGTVMAKFAAATLKAKTAAVVYDVSNDYTKGLAEFFKAAFEKGGGKVVQFDSYGKDDVDFSAIMTKTASQSPDVLFLPDYYNKVNLLAKQAREKGVKAVLLGGDGWDSPELDTKATEGGYFSNHYSPEDTRAEVQEWVKKYQAKYKAVPDALATLGYDATNLLINAVVTAGSNDPAKIRDAMAATKGFKAVSGSISFDQNGDPVKSAAVIQIKDGKKKFAEAVNP